MLKLNSSTLKQLKKNYAAIDIVIFYAILKLEDTFNIISILHPYMDQYVYNKKLDFKDILRLNQYLFIGKGK